MIEVLWESAAINDLGVKRIGFVGSAIVGLNGIVKGDEVRWNGKQYTVVMTSRLGHLGLSQTGKLPYTLTVCPNEVTK